MDESTLNDLLECSVCLERLDFQSKALPCQHTFCRKCLEVIVASHQELRCPECRVLVDCKIDDLPPNVLLMRILGGMKTLNASIKQSPNNVSHSVPSPISPTNIKRPDSQIIEQIIARRDQGMGQFPSKVLPQNVCHAKALHDFQSNTTGDLSFRKGDVIVLRRRIDQNWFYGHLNGREGVFPINHVQIIVPLPVPQCKALYDFQMVPVEDEGCLSFKKGQVINVIRRVDQNWAEGRIGESIGIFPINFVELNSLAKQIMQSNKQGPTTIPGVVSRAVPPTPVNNTPPKTSNVEVNGQPNGVTKREHNEKRHSLTNPVMSTPGPANTSQHRHSVEILSTNTEEITAQSKVVPSHPKSREDKRKFPAMFTALYSYKPQKSDELELKKGGLYYVTERCQDGWYKGMNVDKKSGVFPGNYLVPVNGSNSSNSSSSSKDNTGKSSSSSKKSSNKVAPPALPPRNQNSVWSTYSDLFGRKSHDKSSTSPNNVDSAKKEKEPSLMKRLSNNLKRSSPAAASYSMDNPVFEDSGESASLNLPNKSHSIQNHLSHPVHVRSGSCPTQLLQNLSPNETGKHTATSSASTHSRNPSHLVFASQRLRSQKERPSIQNMPRHPIEMNKDGRPAISHKKSQSLDAGALLPSNSKAISRPSNCQQIKERFRCIVSYPPQNVEMELSLNVGDIVYVSKKREGWYRGSLVTAQGKPSKSGWFPASFVEPDI